jgi:hypothetical protein
MDPTSYTVLKIYFLLNEDVLTYWQHACSHKTHRALTNIRCSKGRGVLLSTTSRWLRLNFDWKWCVSRRGTDNRHRKVFCEPHDQNNLECLVLKIDGVPELTDTLQGHLCVYTVRYSSSTRSALINDTWCWRSKAFGICFTVLQLTSLSSLTSVWTVFKIKLSFFLYENTSVIG